MAIIGTRRRRKHYLGRAAGYRLILCTAYGDMAYYTFTVTNKANGLPATSAVVVAKNPTSAINAGTPVTLTCANPTAIIGTPAVAGNILGRHRQVYRLIPLHSLR